MTMVFSTAPVLGKGVRADSVPEVMVKEALFTVVSKFVGPEAAATSDVPVVAAGSKTKLAWAVPGPMALKEIVAIVPRAVIPLPPRLPES